MKYQLGRLKGRLSVCVVLLACLALLPGSALAAGGVLPDVSVYAEGAYTATDLVLYIYADISVVTTGEPILSFGVKVDYPGTLSYAGATKNEAVWYFGDGAPDYPYMDPEDDGSGVVVIGGKLNTSAPAEGVQGSRVLLGTVEFTHSIVDPQDSDFSGVSVTYGRGDGTGDYKNFVDVDGDVVDGAVNFDTEIHERGDANGSGNISTADYIIVRNSIGSTTAPPWVDCNESGNITTADYICIRNKI